MSEGSEHRWINLLVGSTEIAALSRAGRGAGRDQTGIRHEQLYECRHSACRHRRASAFRVDRSSSCSLQLTCCSAFIETPVYDVELARLDTEELAVRCAHCNRTPAIAFAIVFPRISEGSAKGVVATDACGEPHPRRDVARRDMRQGGLVVTQRLFRVGQFVHISLTKNSHYRFHIRLTDANLPGTVRPVNGTEQPDAQP